MNDKLEEFRKKRNRSEEIDKFIESISKEERIELIIRLVNDMDNELYELEKGE